MNLSAPKGRSHNVRSSGSTSQCDRLCGAIGTALRFLRDDGYIWRQTAERFSSENRTTPCPPRSKATHPLSRRLAAPARKLQEASASGTKRVSIEEMARRVLRR